MAPQISFKCTQDQHKDICKAAEHEHLAVATLCRKLILDNLPDLLPKRS